MIILFKNLKVNNLRGGILGNQLSAIISHSIFLKNDVGDNKYNFSYLTIELQSKTNSQRMLC